MWWEMTEEELAHDEEAQRARQLAYYNTFYGSNESRAVMLDIMRICYQIKDGCSEFTREGACAILAQIAIYQEIRARCGICDEKAVIDAEASTIIVGGQQNA
jgi:hypothetical protein